MKLLSPRERRFASEYVVDLHGTEAAIRAGYAKKSARNTSQALLRRPHVIEAIEQAQAEIAVRNEITVDDYLRELARLRELAARNKQLAAAVSAQELRGRVLGFFKAEGGAPAAAFVLNISGIEK